MRPRPGGPDLKFSSLGIECQRIGRIGLQLDRIGARGVRFMDQIDRFFKRLSMICREFSDNEDGMTQTYCALTDADFAAHPHTPE